MNLYRSLGRWYLQFDWDAFHGIRLAFGRWPAVSPFSDDEYAADDVPHPFADPDALTGNVTTPAGAHSFEAIKEAHEDSPQAMNWVDQSRDGS